MPDGYTPPSPVVEVVGVARTVFTSFDEAMCGSHATRRGRQSAATQAGDDSIATADGQTSVNVRQSHAVQALDRRASRWKNGRDRMAPGGLGIDSQVR